MPKRIAPLCRQLLANENESELAKEVATLYLSYLEKSLERTNAQLAADPNQPCEICTVWQAFLEAI